MQCRVRSPLKGHLNTVNAVVFRTSCQHLISGCVDGLLTVWRPTVLGGSTDEFREQVGSDGGGDDDWT